MAMDAGWTDKYPDPRVLRAEVEAMVESVAEALRARIAPGDLAGLYLKGSAGKQWASPVDYVPETSDVDIHVLFANGAAADRWPPDIEAALAIQADIGAGYQRRMPRPVHTPRPQLLILNHLLADPDYSPSPQRTVRTVFGPSYPEARYDQLREREIAARRLLEDAAILERLPRVVMDKPGRYTWLALRELTWRVSPAGPRALVLLGVPPAEAWSLSRSGLIPVLEIAGQAELAADYGRVYLASWDYFLSGYSDAAPAREAVAAAHAVLARGAALAAGEGR
jgi:hypothetical protein